MPKAAFMGCTNLKKVIYTKVKGDIRYYHTKIKDNLFRNCSNLEEVVFTDSICSIGNQAFMNCTKLKKITFPEVLKNIKEGAFYNTGLEEVVLGKAESWISRKAFANCKNLKTVVIKKIWQIDSRAFYNSTNLEKVTFGSFMESSQVYSNAFENTKWIQVYKRKNQPVIVNGVLVNGAYVKGTVKLDGRKIKRVLGMAFADNKKMKRLKINGVKTIGSGAFAYSSISEASLSGCSSLGINIFSGCKKLKSISVSKMKKIEENVFGFIPGLKKITFGKEVTKLEKDAILHCPNLRTVRFMTKKNITWKPYEDNLKEVFTGCAKIKHVYMNCPKWDPKKSLADWLA